MSTKKRIITIKLFLHSLFLLFFRLSWYPCVVYEELFCPETPPCKRTITTTIRTIKTVDFNIIRITLVKHISSTVIQVIYLSTSIRMLLPISNRINFFSLYLFSITTITMKLIARIISNYSSLLTVKMLAYTT